MAAAVPFLLSICICICFVFLSSLPTARASVHEYARARFTAKGNAFVLHGGSEGLYASSSHQQAYIRFEKITFTRTNESAKSTKATSSLVVQAILFEMEDRETIGGSAYGGQRAVCCTSDLAKLGVCRRGEVIHRPSRENPQWPQVLTASFKGHSLDSSLESRSIPITKTGMYNLYFVYCNQELSGLGIQGKTVWKNPSGYLPGRMAPLMNFYCFMSLAFIVLALFWFSQYVRFWSQVLQLQNCITLVIALGMLEMALRYSDYAQFNGTGVRPAGITMWAVTFGNAKRTAARMIVLLVSMGYGVVRPTLSGLTSKAAVLGAIFFLASEVLELSENAGKVDDFSGKATLLWVLPAAILDAFFLLWMFTSLLKMLDKLQIYFKSSDVHSEKWQTAWIILALWQLLSFCLLCSICVLWAPSQNSTRYAYSDDENEEFDEDPYTQWKPVPVSSMNAWNTSAFADTRTMLGNNGITLIGNTEEEKRE
ncbi:hypothetical protein ACLOJK_001026 [Asimina triloba]